MAFRSPFRFVTQQSLKSCRLEFEDRPLERASLFPLFNDEGRTEMVMITAEESGRILLADWAPGLFTRHWVWRNRLHLRFADLSDASMWDQEHFEDLWHFDPWWVLRDVRFQGHGAVPALQSTNIPGYDPPISRVVFHEDLGRVAYVVEGSSHSVRVRQFAADTLAAATERRRAAHQRPGSVVPTGWRLRPFWPLA